MKSILKTYKQEVNLAIAHYLPDAKTRPGRLHEAMLYSLNAGGKRLRPLLFLAMHEIYKIDKRDPFPGALALECVHTYSLIHDDLPALDNSDLRRGKPTNHKYFDTATAILAGNALFAYAFELITKSYGPQFPTTACALIKELAINSGSQKLIGGQMEDILSQKNQILGDLTYINQNKTAALITAAIKMGIIFNTSEIEALKAGEALGYHLGMAFQLVDDIIDLIGETSQTGKTVKLDLINGVNSYPRVHGLQKTLSEIERHLIEADSFLNGIENTKGQLLKEIIEEIKKPLLGVGVESIPNTIA